MTEYKDRFGRPIDLRILVLREPDRVVKIIQNQEKRIEELYANLSRVRVQSNDQQLMDAQIQADRLRGELATAKSAVNSLLESHLAKEKQLAAARSGVTDEQAEALAASWEKRGDDMCAADEACRYRLHYHEFEIFNRCAKELRMSIKQAEGGAITSERSGDE